MCFHVYSDKSNLTIDFLSESIVLSNYGGSEVTVDLLIRNDGPASIKKVYIIYPNTFLFPKGSNRNLVVSGMIEDLSHTFYPENHPKNCFYYEEKWRFRYRGNTLALSEPKFRENAKRFKGKIEIEMHSGDNKNRLEIIPQHMGVDWCLYIIKYTFFQKEFQETLKKNESIWMRLHFKTIMSCIYPPVKWRRILLRFIDELRFNYEIFGPHEVEHRIIERLNFLKFYIKEYKRKEKKEIKITTEDQNTILHGVRSLTEKLKKANTTYYRNAYLHLFPFTMRLLTNFSTIGRIEPVGTIPNCLSYAEIKSRIVGIRTQNILQRMYYEVKKIFNNTLRVRRVYDWIWAGDLLYDSCNNFIKNCKIINLQQDPNICKLCPVKADPSFKLYFTGRAKNYYFKFIISIIIAILFFKYTFRNLSTITLKDFLFEKFCIINGFATEYPVLFTIIYDFIRYVGLFIILLFLYKAIKKYYKKL